MDKIKRLLGRVVLMDEAADDGDKGGGGGGEGLTLDKVYEALPEELRTEAVGVFQDVKDIPGLLKTAVSAQRLMGSSIRIPGEDASDEARESFYKKLEGVPGIAITKDEQALRKTLGVPEAPDGYQVDLSDLPEEVVITQDELDAKRKEWHEAGLTPAQVEKQVNAWKEHEKASYQQWKDMAQANEKALRDEFGVAYDEKMNLREFALKSTMTDEDIQYLKDSGALNRPGVTKALVKLGEALQDDGTVEASRRAQGALTPDEAKERIKEIQANPAYLNPRDPAHKGLVEKAQKYYAMAYPSQ